jgi:hypothetical protein
MDPEVDMAAFVEAYNAVRRKREEREAARVRSGIAALDTELKECRQSMADCQSRVLAYLQENGHQEALYKTDDAQYKISVKTQKGVRSLKR